MLFIIGLRTALYRLGAPLLVCRLCGHTAAQVITRRVTRFTLFFLPLFPIRTRYSMQCTACAGTTELSRDDAERLTVH